MLSMAQPSSPSFAVSTPGTNALLSAIPPALFLLVPLFTAALVVLALSHKPQQDAPVIRPQARVAYAVIALLASLCTIAGALPLADAASNSMIHAEAVVQALISFLVGLPVLHLLSSPAVLSPALQTRKGVLTACSSLLASTLSISTLVALLVPFLLYSAPFYYFPSAFFLLYSSLALSRILVAFIPFLQNRAARTQISLLSLNAERRPIAIHVSTQRTSGSAINIPLNISSVSSESGQPSIAPEIHISDQDQKISQGRHEKSNSIDSSTSASTATVVDHTGIKFGNTSPGVEHDIINIASPTRAHAPFSSAYINQFSDPEPHLAEVTGSERSYYHRHLGFFPPLAAIRNRVDRDHDFQLRNARSSFHLGRNIYNNSEDEGFRDHLLRSRSRSLVVFLFVAQLTALVAYACELTACIRFQVSSTEDWPLLEKNKSSGTTALGIVQAACTVLSVTGTMSAYLLHAYNTHLSPRSRSPRNSDIFSLSRGQNTNDAANESEINASSRMQHGQNSNTNTQANSTSGHSHPENLISTTSAHNSSDCNHDHDPNIKSHATVPIDQLETFADAAAQHSSESSDAVSPIRRDEHAQMAPANTSTNGRLNINWKRNTYAGETDQFYDGADSARPILTLNPPSAIPTHSKLALHSIPGESDNGGKSGDLVGDGAGIHDGINDGTGIRPHDVHVEAKESHSHSFYFSKGTITARVSDLHPYSQDHSTKYSPEDSQQSHFSSSNSHSHLNSDSNEGLAWSSDQRRLHQYQHKLAHPIILSYQPPRIGRASSLLETTENESPEEDERGSISSSSLSLSSPKRALATKHKSKDLNSNSKPKPRQKRKKRNRKESNEDDRAKYILTRGTVLASATVPSSSSLLSAPANIFSAMNQGKKRASTGMFGFGGPKLQQSSSVASRSGMGLPLFKRLSSRKKEVVVDMKEEILEKYATEEKDTRSIESSFIDLEIDMDLEGYEQSYQGDGGGFFGGCGFGRGNVTLPKKYKRHSSPSSPLALRIPSMVDVSSDGISSLLTTPKRAQFSRPTTPASYGRDTPVQAQRPSPRKLKKNQSLSRRVCENGSQTYMAKHKDAEPGLESHSQDNTQDNEAGKKIQDEDFSLSDHFKVTEDLGASTSTGVRMSPNLKKSFKMGIGRTLGPNLSLSVGLVGALSGMMEEPEEEEEDNKEVTSNIENAELDDDLKSLETLTFAPVSIDWVEQPFSTSVSSTPPTPPLTRFSSSSSDAARISISRTSPSTFLSVQKPQKTEFANNGHPLLVLISSSGVDQPGSSASSISRKPSSTSSTHPPQISSSSSSSGAARRSSSSHRSSWRPHRRPFAEAGFEDHPSNFSSVVEADVEDDILMLEKEMEEIRGRRNNAAAVASSSSSSVRKERLLKPSSATSSLRSLFSQAQVTPQKEERLLPTPRPTPEKSKPKNIFNNGDKGRLQKGLPPSAPCRPKQDSASQFAGISSVANEACYPYNFPMIFPNSHAGSSPPRYGYQSQQSGSNPTSRPPTPATPRGPMDTMRNAFAGVIGGRMSSANSSRISVNSVAHAGGTWGGGMGTAGAVTMVVAEDGDGDFMDLRDPFASPPLTLPKIRTNFARKKNSRQGGMKHGEDFLMLDSPSGSSLITPLEDSQVGGAPKRRMNLWGKLPVVPRSFSAAPSPIAFNATSAHHHKRSNSGRAARTASAKSSVSVAYRKHRKDKRKANKSISISRSNSSPSHPSILRSAEDADFGIEEAILSQRLLSRLDEDGWESRA